MKIYCTICCKGKRNNKEPIESINRYISKRIKSIYEKSKKDAVEFRILSSEFGLLKPDEKITFYDQKLTLEKIPKLKAKIKKQISSEKINEIVFFVGNVKEDIDWKPYISLIQDISSEEEVSLKIVKIKNSFE